MNDAGRTLAILFGSLLLATSVGCSSDDPLPNIVVVLSDDQSYPDFGFMGSSTIVTHELDRLAQEGVVFTHGFNTASTCRYSQMSILTGLHPAQWNARKNQLKRQGVSLREGLEIQAFLTLPALLAKRGYVSFQAGKYWEGSFAMGGFDSGMKGDDWFKDRSEYGRRVAAAGGRSLELGRTTLQPVFDFLAEEREQPFFLWFAPRLPHFPHDPSADDLAPYEGLALTPSARLYYGNITRFDRVVAQLMEELARLELAKNTLVVFLADNGWDQLPDEQRPGPFGGPRGKNSVYELGYRTPIVFHWPGRIGPGPPIDTLVSTVDVFATLLDVAGVKAPPDRVGRSLLPLLTRSGDFSGDFLVETTAKVRPPAWSPDKKQVERASFLRTREWRYVWLEDRNAEALFQIGEDPREMQDLSRMHPEKTRSFRKQINAWKQRIVRPYKRASDPGPKP